jgi:hypothetical protein
MSAVGSRFARDQGGHIEPLQHHKLVDLNHLIDVAAYAPPEVRLLASVPGTQDLCNLFQSRG